MEQKHFIDIQNLIETSTELKASNAGAFEKGDIIQITEKIDGSNASIRYDEEIHTLRAFSRRLPLNESNTLNGFFDYVQTLRPFDFADTPDLVIFGEWLIKNKINYYPESYKKWYVYDIYDVTKNEWKSQTFVKGFCFAHDLQYVHVLYQGPFISWDHCRSFCHSPYYGTTQEGIVVKNITKLNKGLRLPVYLKIVNDEFKETKKVKEVKSPEVLASEAKAYELAGTIVTPRRVEKMLFALRDDGILPDKILPEDMKTVAKNLPKRVFDDCIKEENETVKAINALESIPFSKICNSLTMKTAKELILE